MILMFIYLIYNHNWRNIITIYIYNKTVVVVILVIIVVGSSSCNDGSGSSSNGGSSSSSSRFDYKLREAV